jgi:hypothetical protein
MTGVERIAAERKRQMEEEGWSLEHDDQHTKGELARAAACYVLPEELRNKDVQISATKIVGLKSLIWLWDVWWWKPTPDNRIRELEKAGALIAAEIDRLLRIPPSLADCIDCMDLRD